MCYKSPTGKPDTYKQHMTNDFPFVATNSFTPAPSNSYFQQQQAYMAGLAAKLERDDITGVTQEAQIQALCAEADPWVDAKVEIQPEEENRGFIITSLAVFAGFTAFTLKHGVAFILTLLTYVDAEIADNLLTSN